MYLLNNKINCEINVDDIVEKIYNDENIPKFTFEDFLKYQAIFHPEDKIEFENMLELKEDSDNYDYNKVNNEHDKVFRTILSDKKEAVIFINKALDLNLKESEIEKYKENYITENLIRKTNKEEEKEMLAILDTIAEENERILQQGIRKGIKKGKIEGIKETTINNAKKMKKANIDIKLIMEITGLKKEEIERL